jgi:hypothetical protein
MFEARPELAALELADSANRMTGLEARLNVRFTALKETQRHHADLASRPKRLTREAKDILLVDPDPHGLRSVEAALRSVVGVAGVDACTEFRDARAHLLTQPPDLLITNLRLRAYNGLHLVHLTTGTRTRCVVYSTYDDLMLAREVQATGAFFEHPLRLPLVLHSYVNATLPRRDRRDLTTFDRRSAFRGGRRCSDVPSGGALKF